MAALDKINEELERVKKDLIKSYDEKGLRASGRFAKELESFSRETKDGYSFGILGVDYSGALQGGRIKNRNQSPEGLKAFVGWAGSTFLKQWVKDKGLTISPFAVAWKIAREGVRVPNQYNKGGVLSDVLNAKTIEPFMEIIKFAHVEELRSDIKNILATSGKNIR